jgi:hypothetical protein
MSSLTISTMEWSVPAVFLEVRVVDAQSGGARHELLRRLPVRHDGAVEIGHVACEQVLAIGQVVVVPQQGFDDPERRSRQPFVRERDQLIQQLRNLFFVFRGHGVSSAACRCMITL